MHKPAAQTVVPLAGTPCLLRDLPVPKLRQLGGKFGASVMQKLGITTVGEWLPVIVHGRHRMGRRGSRTQ